MKTEFPGAVPEIPVRDIEKALAYYEHNLGFNIDCVKYTWSSTKYNQTLRPSRKTLLSMKKQILTAEHEP
jgi:predicted enzyme related to lactoylglutathione lyase